MGNLESVDELLAGRHFDRQVIILCVRWYLRFKCSDAGGRSPAPSARPGKRR